MEFLFSMRRLAVASATWPVARRPLRLFIALGRLSFGRSVGAVQQQMVLGCFAVSSSFCRNTWVDVICKKGRPPSEGRDTAGNTWPVFSRTPDLPAEVSMLFRGVCFREQSRYTVVWRRGFVGGVHRQVAFSTKLLSSTNPSTLTALVN